MPTSRLARVDTSSRLPESVFVVRTVEPFESYRIFYPQSRGVGIFSSLRRRSRATKGYVHLIRGIAKEVCGQGTTHTSSTRILHWVALDSQDERATPCDNKSWSRLCGGASDRTAWRRQGHRIAGGRGMTKRMSDKCPLRRATGCWMFVASMGSVTPLSKAFPSDARPNG